MRWYRANQRVLEEFSTLVDEPWYREQYGSLMPEGMSALEHFSAYGAVLGCDPSACFNTTAYLTRYDGVKRRGMNPLWHFVTRGRASGCVVEMSDLASPELVHHPLARFPAKRLEDKLWAGFAQEVLPLIKLKSLSPTDPLKERSYALWALARWAGFHKDYTAALAHLLRRRYLDPGVTRCKDHVLLESDCFLRLADEERAYESIQLARSAGKKRDPELLLALSNVYGRGRDKPSVEQRLKAINAILRDARFCPIQRLDESKPLALDNVWAKAASAKDAERAKVSVLMPVYNAGAQVEVALRSLLAQSWGNLEVVVVDDDSTDDTRDRVSALVATDSRIRLLCLPENRGAYAARNHGLVVASGDFITVHDADDWSHPQKIEAQVRYLLSHPEAIATLTDWARAKDDLYFTGTFRAHATLTSENTSSLMFRRAVVDTLGQWDLARTGADTEFILRLKAVYGASAVVSLFKGVPLAFALDQDRSLTRRPVTHAKTLFYGARREYREAACAWHQAVGPEVLKLPRVDNQRPFPIPSVMRASRRSEPRCYDLVIVADFNLDGGAFVSTLHYVNAAIALGKTVAIFHWRRADLDVTMPLKASLRERARAGQFDILSAGETVDARRVIVGYPVVLRYRLDVIPTIRTSQVVILVNQMAARLTDGGDPQYDPRRIQSTVQTLFGVDPLWVPISGLVHRLMVEDTRYPTPYSDIWSPLLDVDLWHHGKPRWRGAERERPVLGRHARDHYTKWPSSPAALADAYCADQPCDVRLLGGADYALNVLGRRPGNWQIREFAPSAIEFLAELDFFIHYPHERYIEEFGRAVLEAMGLGIPVILPPVFEETFGEFAHYAEPEAVWPLVQRLWRDESAYVEAAERGLAFVRERAHYSVLATRLERLDLQLDGAG